MEKEYLVIFSAHVDSEEKKETVIKTLKELKYENIDICFVTHSKEYLNEISNYVKYIIYDDENNFLKLEDYLSNANLIKDENKYGISYKEILHSFGKIVSNIPNSPHSKSALKLVRDGTIFSYYSNYKWTVYYEYDIPIPTKGLDNFIKLHISELTQSDKECYYYQSTKNNFDFLWGGFFVFKTDKLLGCDKFFKTDWYSNGKNWIENWENGFFESIIEFLFKKIFKDKIITKEISNYSKEYWDVEDYFELSKFKFENTYYSTNRYLRENLEIGIYPEIVDKRIKLFLYYFNNGDKKITVEKILIHTDNKIIFHKKNYIINETQWSVINLNIEENNNDIIIDFVCDVKCCDEKVSKKQTINYNMIEHIHKNVNRIIFN